MASTPKPVFFIGNKRSGTSLLVRLMNLHPEVFVTHEVRDDYGTNEMPCPCDG